MKKDIAIFLYSKSPIVAQPWADAGIECHLFDVKVKNNVEGRLIFHGGDIRGQRKLLGQLCRDNNVKVLGSFVPCTDMATLGAKHFETKAKNDALFWARAMELVFIGLDAAEYFRIPYFIENPRTVLGTLLRRKADFKFHPYMFGGHLPDNHHHSLFPKIYPGRDAYKKETWLWVGNGFVFPKIIEVNPVGKEFPGWKKVGGKSDRTKEIRSVTPEGFSRAVFQSNYK